MVLIKRCLKWFRVTLAILFLLLPSILSASTLEHTAVLALKEAYSQPNADKWEYGGIIVYKDGTYQYSVFPVTSQKVDMVSVDAGKLNDKGDTLVGLYHTHPCVEGYYHEYFSLSDLFSPFFWNVPTFMLDTCSGNVHEFDPKKDKASETGIVVIVRATGKRIHMPSGRIVGNIHQYNKNHGKTQDRD